MKFKSKTLHFLHRGFRNGGLQKELLEFVQDGDVDFFGVADLISVYQYILTQSGEHLAAFPRAIVLGIRLPDAW